MSKCVRLCNYDLAAYTVQCLIQVSIRTFCPISFQYMQHISWDACKDFLRKKVWHDFPPASKENTRCTVARWQKCWQNIDIYLGNIGRCIHTNVKAAKLWWILLRIAPSRMGPAYMLNLLWIIPILRKLSPKKVQEQPLPKQNWYQWANSSLRTVQIPKTNTFSYNIYEMCIICCWKSSLPAT